MPESITCRSVRRRDGRVYVRAGKTELEFASPAALRRWVRDVVDGPDVRMLSIALLLAHGFAGDETGGTTFAQRVEGKTLTLDLGSTTPVVVT